MLVDELINLIDRIRKIKAEGQTLEIKAAHNNCPTKLYDTISSFSNQDSGGIIVFGIDESKDYEPVGVYDVQDLQKKVTEQCKQMEPSVRAVFTIAEYKGAVVCSAEIPSLDVSERPCYYKGVGKVRGSYIRVGEADLVMSDYELYSFEAFRKHQHDDERKVDTARMNMLDEDQLGAYIDICKKDRPGFSRLSYEDMLEMMHITVTGVPTMAAVFNFGIYPQGYFPELAITCVAVQGTEIGETAEDEARFIDNRRIEGTLGEMVRDALAFCQRNMKTRTIVDSQTGMRKDKTEYPINAIREAILNALIHRDYSVHSETIPVQIMMYNDRIEIHSPGGLYGRMTLEQLGYAKSELRNPTLATMAERITEAENRNSGIPTMRRECKAYGLPAPKFENRRDEFVVTFYNGTSLTYSIDGYGEARLSESSRVMRTVKEIKGFCAVPRSRRELATFLGIGTIPYAMERYVRPLLESGELKMTNPGKPQSSKQRFYSE